MNNYLIVMPAYNEEKNIGSLLSTMIPYRDNTIIINDGSIDNTYSIIRSYGFKCINNVSNLGISKCIELGIKYAVDQNIKKVILMDSDGQHSPVHIPIFLKEMEKYEFVFGCRYNEDKSIPTNKWASNIFAAALYGELTGRFFTDVSCGFKGISISKGLMDIIRSSQGYGIIYDIVNYALLKQADISIVPIYAIYEFDELLYTKSKEIEALMNSVNNLRKIWRGINSCRIGQIIQMVNAAVKYREKFYVNIADINVWAFPVCEDGFIFQIDPNDILIWLKKCRSFKLEV